MKKEPESAYDKWNISVFICDTDILVVVFWLCRFNCSNVNWYESDESLERTDKLRMFLTDVISAYENCVFVYMSFGSYSSLDIRFGPITCISGNNVSLKIQLANPNCYHCMMGNNET